MVPGQYSKQKLVLGTHTSEGEQNYLMLAEVRVRLLWAAASHNNGACSSFTEWDAACNARPEARGRPTGQARTTISKQKPLAATQDISGL